MAQHDYVIANGTGAAVRSDLNAGFAAIVSQNSGATAPSTTYAYQSWADTSAGVMKMRNGANNAWISLYELDGTFLAGDISLSAGAAATPSLFFTGDTNTGIYSPGADQIGIATGGTARITVDGSGNVNIDSNTLYVDAANNRVGLGTSSLNAQLEVNDYINASYSELVAFTGAKGSFVGIPTNQLAIVDSTTQAAGVGGEISFEGKFAATDTTSFAAVGGVKEDSTLGNYGGAFVVRTRINGGNLTEKTRVDSSGRLLVGVSSNANGGILQLSSGITFPATAVAASDVNTLDDYEEGTWTPTIYGTSTAGTTTYFQQYGLYTKIGRVVTVQVFITITNQTGTGALRLGGLPFTAGSGANTFPCAVKTTDLALTALYYPVFSVAGGTTYINMEQTPVGGGAIYSIAIDTAFNVELIATYFV
jgi:hypothetical protein